MRLDLPLGTVLDLIGTHIKRTAPLRILKGNLKYYLLVTILVAALFNMNLAGLFDPMAILLRFVTFSLYPLWAGSSGKDGSSFTDFSVTTGTTPKPGYAFLKGYLLPFRTTFYPLAFVSLLFFLGILLSSGSSAGTGAAISAPSARSSDSLPGFPSSGGFPKRLCADCGTAGTIVPRLSMRRSFRRATASSALIVREEVQTMIG